MDFETLGVALPRYAGMSPYDQIPFQWSVHIQRKPGAELEHLNSWRDDANDPRPEFVKALCQVIGKKGSILAYNSGFESGCLESLAEWFPQYKDEIGNIQERLWDLLPVMRAHVYHLAFCGSYSLKRVFPPWSPKCLTTGWRWPKAAMQASPGRRWFTLISKAMKERGFARHCSLIAGRTRWRWCGCWMLCEPREI